MIEAGKGARRTVTVDYLNRTHCLILAVTGQTTKAKEIRARVVKGFRGL